MVCPRWEAAIGPLVPRGRGAEATGGGQVGVGNYAGRRVAERRGNGWVFTVIPNLIRPKQIAGENFRPHVV